MHDPKWLPPPWPAARGARAPLSATGAATVTVEHALCDSLTLVTRGSGTISLRDVRREGEFHLLRTGGPITVEETPAGR